MAKKNSKGWRNRKQSKITKNMMEEKKNEISVANISISIPQPDPSTNQHSYLVTTYGQMVESETEEAKDVSDSFSGFIFMCNAITKPECFRYRVFGLPAGKRDVVEKIKTGMKLFLYDFDLKLLYGVYEASCNGQLNLEPYAFGGKYPAQVKFSIHKECLPLQERVLKCAIEGNYHGGKFNQELNGFHVRNLTLSFRPLAIVPPLPPIALDRQIGSPPPIDNSYHIGIHPSVSLAINHYTPSIQQREIIQHKDLSDHHGTMLNHVPYSMGHLSLSLPPGNPYYELNTGQTYLHGNVPQQMLHDPSLSIIERAQNTSLEAHYPTVSYYQERGPYLQQPISQVLQYPQGQGKREVPADITFYQNKYSEAAYRQLLQANPSSHYGIPGQVLQANASSHYEIPGHVSQENASSHYKTPAQVSSSHYRIPGQVSLANASSSYGIPGHVSQENASSHYETPAQVSSSHYGIPGQVSLANASSSYGIPGYVSQENASSHYEIPAQVSSSHYGIPGQVSLANASSSYGIPAHEPVSSYHFQHGP